MTQLPHPDLYNDWRDWARALMAEASRAITERNVVVLDPAPTDPPTEFENITILDELGRIILNPQGLWIWDPAGNLPISPNLFAINTQHLVNAAVTTAKLRDLAVDTMKLADLAATAAKLADTSVTSAKLMDGAVTSLKIADLAVGSAAIGLAAVGTIHIANAAITSALIGDLQVISAKIDDLAVNSAKIANAAINSSKIDDLAVTNAKIANGAIDALKIGAAVINRTHIQDGEIVNAKIGEIIQSSNWSDITKVGWRINKLGQIEGSGISIYDATGQIIFGAGNFPAFGGTNLFINGDFSRGLAGWLIYSNDDATIPVIVSAVAGRRPNTTALRLAWGAASPQAKGIFSTNFFGLNNEGRLQPNRTYVLSFYTRGELMSPGTMIVAANIAYAAVEELENPQVTGDGLWKRHVFRLRTGAVADPNVFFGVVSTVGGAYEISDVMLQEGQWPTEFSAALGLVDYFTASNIGTYIANAAIGQAQIANAAIGTAQIANAAVGTAQIADAAIGAAQIANAAVGTAQIADASITDAKIVNLVVNKLLSGNLDAVIEVVNGRFQFTVGASRLVLGNSFGSTNQFLLWFGPNIPLVDMNESNGTVWIKTNGDAYFGGTISAGILKNAARSTSIAVPNTVEVGPFSSNNNPRQVVISYFYEGELVISDTASWTGNPEATVHFDFWNGSTWQEITSQTFAGAMITAISGNPGDPGLLRWRVSGSITNTQGGPGTSFFYRARLSSRTDPTIFSTSIGQVMRTQELGLTSIEQ